MNEFLKNFDEIKLENRESLRFYEEICSFSKNSINFTMETKEKIMKKTWKNSFTYESFEEKKEGKTKMYDEFTIKVFIFFFTKLPCFLRKSRFLFDF